MDPGLRGCGVALFRDEELEQAVYVEGNGSAQRAEAWVQMVSAVREFVGTRRVERLVVELPQVYVAVRTKGDPNDLVQLGAVVGALCLAFQEATQHVFLPAEWKGQVPKEIVHARVASRLSAAEQGRITCRRKSLLHNVLDAVGIGLKDLGRL